jgi:hypothetical protein
LSATPYRYCPSIKFWINSKGLLAQEGSAYVLPERGTMKYLESAGISEFVFKKKLREK